ncbi:hypothetical protein M513_06286 [Trichuris suis]|uniref:Uncharacterized protein n=1 Tax=Trichuris suis TaxID=68888 RepID=A0A085M6E9_9BILA|nr:hypothetical protein M513_06286 [Trichuris suis]
MEATWTQPCQIVSFWGISDKGLQRRLLAEQVATFDVALKKALATETARLQAWFNASLPATEARWWNWSVTDAEYTERSHADCFAYSLMLM